MVQLLTRKLRSKHKTNPCWSSGYRFTRTCLSLYLNLYLNLYLKLCLSLYLNLSLNLYLNLTLNYILFTET